MNGLDREARRQGTKPPRPYATVPMTTHPNVEAHRAERWRRTVQDAVEIAAPWLQTDPLPPRRGNNHHWRQLNSGRMQQVTPTISNRNEYLTVSGGRDLHAVVAYNRDLSFMQGPRRRGG